MSEDTSTGPLEFRERSFQEEIRHVHRELENLEAESLSGSLPEGFNVEKYYTSRRDLRAVYSKASGIMPIILSIVSGSIWGVLGRKGLMALTTYNGSFLSGVIWANFAACIVMGMAVDSANVWKVLIDGGDYADKGIIGVYVGITTGFCGTLSSFSSVILEAFNKSADTLPSEYYSYPNSAYGIMEFLAVIIAHMCLSLTGFQIGKHFIDMIDPALPALSKKVYRTLEKLWIVLGLVAFIIIVVLIGVKYNGSWRSWTFACFFAPFGALSRFFLSKYLNPKIKNFPLGTFTANLWGTLLLAIFTLLGRGKLPGNALSQIVTNVLNCHVLSGLDDGFCGALTTVSTLVVELFGLRTLHSYRYGFYSIASSYIVTILVLGSYNWTVGLTNPVC
mmetsp:Transcript_9313/g.11612  ORF Transcript_9313/g.11612 Transcript_9313/m.11612 type:complete len:391 (-) Transcript_9313:101-1273(-)